MRQLILNEVAPDKVVEGESYLVLLADGDFIYAVFGGGEYWYGENMPSIPKCDVGGIFEAPRENKVFAD